ncbi:MAG: hypothetical protein NDP19_04375, partial [Crenarchaeota archaeon]|nr:hypothetical protein [Thermoproteota archaeon]
EEYAIGVLRRLRNATGIYSWIDIYIANFTAGNSKIYINHTNFSVPIKYMNSFVITGDTTNELRITRFDLVWKNSTTIIVAYIKQYITLSGGVYVDAYNVAYRKLRLPDTWTSESTLAKGTGMGYDIKTSWSGANRIIAFIGSNATSAFGVTLRVSFAANLFINEATKIPVSFTETETAKGTPYSAYLSNIIFAPGYTYIVAALVTSIGSELATIAWDGIATSINAKTILTSDDLTEYNIPVLDFKHPSITPLGSSYCLVSSVGYSETDNYLIYFRGQFSDGSILPPSPSSAGEITYEKTLKRTLYTLLADNDPSDNEAVLMWIDFSEKSIIKYALVQFTDSGLERTNVSTCVGLSDVVSFDAMFMGSLNITVMLNSTHSSYTLANNSIFIAHISDTGAGKLPYVALGLRDSDMDFLGDCEEEFYMTDPNNSDSDFDEIPDGSEVFIYHTKPNMNDTDNDGLYDGIEIRGVDIPGVGIRQTDPLNPDTDSDGLLDGEEALGVNRIIPEDNLILHLYSDPTVRDTDGDGLSDYAEFSGWTINVIYANGSSQTYRVYSNATNPDSDGDGLSDSLEFMLGSDPWREDTDYDGLTDIEERYIGTSVFDADTDNDYLTDYDEVNGVKITNPMTGEIFIVYTNPLNPDTDSDGLLDGEEISGFDIPGIGHVQTDPTLRDTDFDMLTDAQEVYWGTNPWNPDTDDDGLDDYKELIVGTDPLNPDTDGDGLLDGEEVWGIEIPGIGIRVTNPTLSDTDGDGLNDYEECKIYGTDPTSPDTDRDGLSDPAELAGWDVTIVFLNGSTQTWRAYPNPLKADTDSDGLSDRIEFLIETDPTRADTDGDGLSDSSEYQLGTDPKKVDTDGDGLLDYDEAYVWKTDPLSKDTDGDGLLDFDEIVGIQIGGIGLRKTDPLSKDTDGDGLSDYDEVFKTRTDPTRADTDGDGLSDSSEYQLGTDPKKVDTDGDGLLDYDEVVGIQIEGIGLRRTDPLSKDTDGDGLSDFDEVVGIQIGGIGLRKTDPLSKDTDGDGLSDYNEAYVWKTDPLSKDTDGDGLLDSTEVLKTRTNPRLRDTDGDFIPDNLDILLPTTNDFTYIIVAVMLIGLLRLHSYGLFRNWRRDIIGVGLSDLGGILMFVLPERFPVDIDTSLISSGITGIFTMAGELSQRALNRIVLSEVVPILIDKGEYTLMWVFLRREYPRVIKQLSKLHREMEKAYSAILAEWSGVVEELIDVKSWLMVRLYPEESLHQIF